MQLQDYLIMRLSGIGNSGDGGGIRSFTLEDGTYDAVTGPTGNPSTLGYFEYNSSTDTYIASTDTSVVEGKTYYVNNSGKTYLVITLQDGSVQKADVSRLASSSGGSSSGFEDCVTTFPADGSVVETYSDRVVTTTFPSSSRTVVTVTDKATGAVISTKTIVMNADGSITETVS